MIISPIISQKLCQLLQKAFLERKGEKKKFRKQYPWIIEQLFNVMMKCSLTFRNQLYLLYNNNFGGNFKIPNMLIDALTTTITTFFTDREIILSASEHGYLQSLWVLEANN